MLALCLTALLLPADAAPRRWTPAGEVALAAAYAESIPVSRQKYARFISLHDIPPADRELYTQVMGGVFNSLSHAPVLLTPVVVPGSDGTLLYLDLSITKIPLRALDNLGLTGSGPAPFPDPFFHQLVKEEAYEEVGYFFDAAGNRCERGTPGAVWKATGKRATKSELKVIHGPWLNPYIEQLAEITDSASPIFEVRWFWYNALIEPQYHLLLGLDDSQASVLKLAAVNEGQSDDVGSTTRGAVLVSEVANRNRFLERRPTVLRYGRGNFHKSLDFKTSIAAQDAEADLLNAKADANEIIFSLPDGMQAYYVNDANLKRLDKADPDVAQDGRTRMKDHQVWTGFHCMGCHEAEKGIIEIDDDVKVIAKPDVELISKKYAKGNADRGQKILEEYFSIDFNDLVKQDQAFFAATVFSATGGLTCAKYSDGLQAGIWDYTDKPVSLEQVAFEAGYDVVTVTGVIQRSPGLSHALVGLLKRPQRRDQIEAGVAELYILLAALPRQEAGQ